MVLCDSLVSLGQHFYAIYKESENPDLVIKVLLFLNQIQPSENLKIFLEDFPFENSQNLLENAIEASQSLGWNNITSQLQEYLLMDVTYDEQAVRHVISCESENDQAKVDKISHESESKKDSLISDYLITDNDSLIRLINQKQFQIMYDLSIKNKIFAPKNIEQYYGFIIKLSYSILNVESFEIAVLLLSKLSSIASAQYLIIINAIESILKSTQDSVLMQHPNPIKACILISELLLKLQKINQPKAMQIESLRIKFIIIICEFAQSIHDLDKLIGLYSDTIGNEKILNKILNKHQKYHEILNQQIMVQVTIKILFNRFPPKIRFWQASLLIKNWANLEFQEVPDIFQYRTWRDMIFLRILVEDSLRILIFILYLKYSIKYATNITLLQDPGLSAQDRQRAMDNLNQVEQDYSGMYCELILLVSIVIQRVLFKLLLKETLFKSYYYILDFFIISIGLGIIYEINIKENPDLDNIIIINSMLLTALCLRVFWTFMVCQHIASTVRQILLVFYDIVPLILIFTFILLSYSILLWAFFWTKNEQFETLFISIQTLIQVTLGTVNFQLFEKDETLGIVLLILYIIISTIVLINVLIAALSSKYDEASQKAVGYYTQTIHDCWSFSRYKKGFGSFTVLTVPFNILSVLLVIPYLTIPKRMYKYDKYFCYLGYLPMFLLGNIVFLVFNMILLIPILIMKIYTSLLTRNPIKFIESVLFDPYIILKDIFKSFPIFWNYMFMKQFKQQDQTICDENLMKDIQQLIYENEKSTIQFDEINKEVLNIPDFALFNSYDELQDNQNFHQLASAIVLDSYKRVNVNKAIAKLQLIDLIHNFSTKNEDGIQIIDLKRMQNLLKVCKNNIQGVNLPSLQAAIIKVNQE